MKAELNWFGLIALCHSRGRGDCLRNIETFFAYLYDGQETEREISIFKFICLQIGIGQYD